MSKEDDFEFEVKEIISLDEGLHKGSITDIKMEQREDKKTKQKFSYVDIVISLEDEPLDEIKVGFPASVSEMSGFGKLILASGLKFEAGEKITMKQIKKSMVGKSVKFQTYNTEQGFSNVLNETLKFVD